MKRPNFYAMAAGEFTSGDMNDNLKCLEDLMAEFDSGELCAWEPFENEEVDDIHCYITDLAARFEAIYYIGKRDMFLELDAEYIVDEDKETIEVGAIVWVANDFNMDNSFYDEVHSIEGEVVTFEDGTVADMRNLTLLKVKPT